MRGVIEAFRARRHGCYRLDDDDEGWSEKSECVNGLRRRQEREEAERREAEFRQMLAGRHMAMALYGQRAAACWAKPRELQRMRREAARSAARGGGEEEEEEEGLPKRKKKRGKGMMAWPK